jgi:hypothetical protein
MQNTGLKRNLNKLKLKNSMRNTSVEENHFRRKRRLNEQPNEKAMSTWSILLKELEKVPPLLKEPERNSVKLKKASKQ